MIIETVIYLSSEWTKLISDGWVMKEIVDTEVTDTMTGETTQHKVAVMQYDPSEEN